LLNQVSNWHEFSNGYRSLCVDVPGLFFEALEKTFGLRSDTYRLLPELEPPSPKKWIIRVGSPFLPIDSKENVKDAIGKLFLSGEVQWKLLTVITLERMITDNINRMITISGCRQWRTIEIKIDSV
jgi:hypothetical protein